MICVLHPGKTAPTRLSMKVTGKVIRCGSMREAVCHEEIYSKSLTTYIAECDGCFLIIKNVPCSKCTQCGKEYLNGVTLQKIEVILEKFKTMLTEIAIVDYNKAA